MNPRRNATNRHLNSLSDARGDLVFPVRLKLVKGLEVIGLIVHRELQPRYDDIVSAADLGRVILALMPVVAAHLVLPGVSVYFRLGVNEQLVHSPQSSSPKP